MSGLPTECVEHAAKALAEGKCVQCRYPWHDGICSCGRHGAEEVHIAGVAIRSVSQSDENREFRAKMKRDIAKTNANLRPAEELEGLWEK